MAVSDVFQCNLKHALLSNKSLLVDGGIGSSLRASGTPSESHKYPDQLNITHPEAVVEVHRGFINAGVNIITTNTFQANGLRCPEGYTVRQLNEAAVRNAKQAISESNNTNTATAEQCISSCGETPTEEQVVVSKHSLSANKAVYILGSLGPLCTGNTEEACEHYTNQIETLIREGVDGLLIETITHIAEAKTALEIARRYSVDIPIIVSICLVKNGILPGGETYQEAIEALNLSSIDAIGVNCVDDMHLITEAIAHMCKVMPSKQLYACPNAGFPDTEGTYSLTCAEYKNMVHALKDLGVKLIGGCCGVAATHLSALKVDGHDT